MPTTAGPATTSLRRCTCGTSTGKRQRAHACFLDDADWCLRHRKLVESYLLAFALNDHDFVDSLVIDFPVVRQEFGLVLGAWQHDEQRPEARGFSMAMVSYINQIRGARRRYYD